MDHVCWSPNLRRDLRRSRYLPGFIARGIPPHHIPDLTVGEVWWLCTWIDLTREEAEHG